MALYKVTELSFNSKSPKIQFEALEYHRALAKFKELSDDRGAELDREDEGEIQEGESLTAYFEGAHWIKLQAE